MIAAPVPAVAPDVPDSTTVQANVAPVGVDVNAIPVDVPEQIVSAVGVAATVGVGLTVITTSIGDPTQTPIVGVTVYVVVPETSPVTDNVWLIVAPVPALAPDVPDSTTVQANVAPAGVELNEIPVDVPEQIASVAGVAIAVGNGFTVITTSIGSPTQVPMFGVMV